MSTIDLPEFLTVEETARMLRLHPRTIRNRIKSGLLPAKQIMGGKNKLIAKSDALALLVNSAPATQVKSPLVNPLATLEGRARAIEMLRRLREEEGDEEEQQRAAEVLAHITPISLREWSPDDWTRLDAEEQEAGKAA
jgi:excisionase family DNA binding protein